MFAINLIVYLNGFLQERPIEKCRIESVHGINRKSRPVCRYSFESGNPVNVSGSLCPFLLTLRGRLGQLSAALSRDSLMAVMRQLIGRIGRLLIDEVVSQSSFNSYGAAQMRFDVASALIPLLNSIGGGSPSVRISAEHDVVIAELNDKLKV